MKPLSLRNQRLMHQFLHTNLPYLANIPTRFGARQALSSRSAVLAVTFCDITNIYRHLFFHTAKGATCSCPKTNAEMHLGG